MLQRIVVVSWDASAACYFVENMGLRKGRRSVISPSLAVYLVCPANQNGAPSESPATPT